MHFKLCMHLNYVVSHKQQHILRNNSGLVNVKSSAFLSSFVFSGEQKLSLCYRTRAGLRGIPQAWQQWRLELSPLLSLKGEGKCHYQDPEAEWQKRASRQRQQQTGTSDKATFFHNKQKLSQILNNF